MTAETVELLLSALRQALKNEPDRDFTTVELSKLSGVSPTLLVAMAQYLPEAHRGEPRQGVGRFKDRQVRPWIWRYAGKDR